MMISEKRCLECGERIVGRTDKKFCDDPCRVTYNNRLNSDNTNLIRNINNALRKNRRILLQLNSSGKTRTTRERLLEKGFDFQYFTSIYRTREGAVYHYCYEQGYLQTEGDRFLLVVRPERT
jgi:hypothetical protein